GRPRPKGPLAGLRSERDLVVDLVVEPATAGGSAALAAAPGAAAPVHRAGAAEIRPAAAAILDTLAAAAPAEHGEGRVESLQHGLDRIVRLPLHLVGARLQLSLQIDGRGLAQVLHGDLAESLVEDDDAVRFGLLAALA